MSFDHIRLDSTPRFAVNPAHLFGAVLKSTKKEVQKNITKVPHTLHFTRYNRFVVRGINCH